MAESEPPTIMAYPHRSDIYTYRVPTPPRIVVPPPNLNADSMPDIPLRTLSTPSHKFLSTISYSNLIRSNAPLEWTYERRRSAQPILPFLSLGPMTAAKDEAYLLQENITMLLGVRQKQAFASRLMQSATNLAEKLGIEIHYVDSSSNADLIHSFPATTDVINAHLTRIHTQSEGKKNGKVLVFCESGNERSAAVVAAYLMETHVDVDYIKAMQLCQAQRFCVNFDDGLKRLLQGYWDIVQAKREVGCVVQGDGGRAQTWAVGGGNAKRGLERDYADGDEDMDVDGETLDDMERFGNRSFAPFQNL
jgi:protein-tyrosine phosphatase